MQEPRQVERRADVALGLVDQEVLEEPAGPSRYRYPRAHHLHGDNLWEQPDQVLAQFHECLIDMSVEPVSLERLRHLNPHTRQRHVIRADAQVRSMMADGEPVDLLLWLGEQMRVLEGQVKAGLDKYSAGHPVGEWARSVTGVGPVIAAGLLAHIDIKKAPTAGHIFSFAGLNPKQKWEKGQKRPWNAQLKCLCWKLGESFVKVQNNENDVYGTLYAERKVKEIAKNEAGEFVVQAEAVLAVKRIGKTTDAFKAYSQGKLPPAHIHARAKRWAVKIFLSNLHEVWYEIEYGEPAPAPYPFAQLGHVHKIEPGRLRVHRRGASPR